MLGGAPVCALAAFCPDLERWPAHWQYDELDIAPGQQIVAFITPFLLHLLGENLTPKTRRRHRDNVWLLGGELIPRRYEDDKLRTSAMPLALSKLVSQDGGPLIHPRISEAEQDAFVAACRKMHEFLRTNQEPVHQM